MSANNYMWAGHPNAEASYLNSLSEANRIVAIRGPAQAPSPAPKEAAGMGAAAAAAGNTSRPQSLAASESGNSLASNPLSGENRNAQVLNTLDRAITIANNGAKKQIYKQAHLLFKNSGESPIESGNSLASSPLSGENIKVLKTLDRILKMSNNNEVKKKIYKQAHLLFNNRVPPEYLPNIGQTTGGKRSKSRKSRRTRKSSKTRKGSRRNSRR